jgi:hypothetical protein
MKLIIIPASEQLIELVPHAGGDGHEPVPQS